MSSNSLQKLHRSREIKRREIEADHQWMTEINRRSPVSLVPGPVDPVESVESVDHVDLVELYRSSKQLVAWGFRLSVMPPCFLSVDTNRCYLFFKRGST